jgi:ABC-type transport system substrate-binding protein
MLRLARHSASTNEPHVARLRYAFYSTPGDLIGAMTSDTADIGTGFTATDLPALRQAAPGSFRIVVQPTSTLEHLELNVGSAQFRGKPNPLTDVRVRQALALATDRLGLMRAVLHLGPLQVRDLAAFSPWQTAPYAAEPGADRDITGAWDPIAQRYVPYGPKALRDARTLLAEAGYPQGLDLELYKPSRPNLRSAETQFISQDWSRIGVRVSAETLRNCSLGCGFDYAPPWEQGNFQALLIALAGSPGPGSLKLPLLPNPTPSGNSFGPPRPFDYAGIDDPQLVRDWKSAEAATSSMQRDAWYRRIQERVIRQAYWIPLYWWPQITAVSPRVKGFGQSGEAPVWRPQDWRLGG